MDCWSTFGADSPASRWRYGGPINIKMGEAEALHDRWIDRRGGMSPHLGLDDRIGWPIHIGRSYSLCHLYESVGISADQHAIAPHDHNSRRGSGHIRGRFRNQRWSAAVQPPVLEPDTKIYQFKHVVEV